MARLKGIDNLDDLTGKLSAGFNGVSDRLERLETKYKASSPEASKVLTDFFLAASQLQRHESEFNRRAKPTSPDLKANLRNKQQLAAVKTFETAKQHLLEINPRIGGEILKAVQRTLDEATKPIPRNTAKRSFSAATPAA